MTSKYKPSSEISCRICNLSFSGKKLTNHILKEHSLSSKEYTIKYIYGGNAPKCPICETEPRYSALSFKKYCIEHSCVAETEGGKVGGKAEAWNKGKTKETDERVAQAAELVSGEKNPFYGKEHSNIICEQIGKKLRLKIDDLRTRISLRKSEFELVTPLEEYKSKQKTYLEFKCVFCGTFQKKSLSAFERGSRCYICHPENKSNWELEVLEYVRRKFPDAISGDRKILSGKEIDVYVPSRKVGIECHGLYWHSESSARNINKNSSKDKLEACESFGVKLFQFFYDEWRDKRKICESMIDHRLGVSKNAVGARKLELVELSTKQQREFFNASHIAGYTPSHVSFGLSDKNGVVYAALSLRLPMQSKKYKDCYEISRFSTLPGWSVVGGLQRLMKKAVTYSESSSKDLMTYVDRRFGDGHGYLSCGFELIGETGIDYWYTDNSVRYNRFKYRAKDGVPESEVARLAGVTRIYGCGSLIMKRICVT